MTTCPLCGAGGLSCWHRDRRREYWRCPQCALVSVPPRFHLDAAAEKAEYDRHQNHPDDAGYRTFLQRLAQPLLERLPPAARCLDFGCGPGPALAAMLTEAGHQVALYDKFYQPDSAVLQHQYDAVTATEVVEHLAQPDQVWPCLYERVAPAGWLAVMTKRVRDQAAFARWHYIQDPTHISFYSDETFHWIARHWNLACEFMAADVALLRKPL